MMQTMSRAPSRGCDCRGRHCDGGSPATRMGIFTLDYVFGTAPPPGGGLQYLQVGSDDWWDGDGSSPTYNTHQHCRKDKCHFDTSGSENLNIPEYVHSV